jgi:hypothetical protein
MIRVLVELAHPQSHEKDAQTIRDHMPRQNVVAVQGDAVYVSVPDNSQDPVGEVKYLLEAKDIEAYISRA